MRSCFLFRMQSENLVQPKVSAVNGLALPYFSETMCVVAVVGAHRQPRCALLRALCNGGAGADTASVWF